jgi:ElaA protein
MKNAIDFLRKKYKPSKIKISAQKYLRKFYEDLGFEIVTEEYLEDGIPHFGMMYVNHPEN